MYSLDITVNQAIDVLADVLEPFTGVIYQAQDNRVEMPLDKFAILTPITFKRLTTTKIRDIPEKEQALYSEVREVSIQLDIYGAGGAERAIAVETAFRSSLMYELLTARDSRVIPLYSETAVQASMINSESQWQERYIVMLRLQINMTLTAPQDYFNRVEFKTCAVDTLR